MRKLLVGAAAALGLFLVTPAAYAAGPYQQPGYDHAAGNTTCADHGAFGSFGAQGDFHDFGINNLGSNGEPGATNWNNTTTGATTGGNNSSLCGNGADPAPFTG